MARLMFPDERLTYSLLGSYVAFVPAGTVVSVYTDTAGTVPADVQHADGSAVSMVSPLVVDSYSQVPLFLGPADGTDTLYVKVAGGVPIPVYARTDDRLDAVESKTVGLGQADDTTALANPAAGVASFRRIVVPTSQDVGGTLTKGNGADTVVKNLDEWQDGNGSPIAAIGTVGGIYVNDQIRQHYSLLANPNVFSNIYGHRMQNALTEFAWAGPPGNMLSFADACHEVFESTRAGSKGGWQIFGGSGSDVAAVADSSLPTTLKHAVELTSHTTSMTALTASGVFGYPVTAGSTYTALACVKAVATTRSPTLGMQWWDSGGVFISTTSGSATATNTSTYTLLTSGTLTAPGGAAYGAPCLVWSTSVNGEKHRVAGAGVWAGTVTEWAPPFVGAPYGTWGQAAAGDRWRRKSTPTDPEGRDYICTTGGVPAAQVWTPMGSARLATATPAATATSGSVGTGTSAARSDHVHASPQLSANTPVALGSAGAGSGTASSKDDHVHPTTGLLLTSALSTSTPAALATAGSAGSSSNTSKADHAHGLAAAWADYTPTLTNITIGNGTIAARYALITPNLMAVYLVITLGSTSSVTGAIGVSLPAGVTAETTTAQRATSSCFDSSADTTYSGQAAVTSSQLNAIRSHGIASTAAAAVPFTWAVSDNLRIWGLIELV